MAEKREIRAPDGKWVKGTGSPNPGGRSKALAELRDMCREVTPEGIRAVTEMARSDPKSEVRLAAWGMLFDRGYGKPTQPISQDEHEVGDLNPEEMRARAIEDAREVLRLAEKPDEDDS